MPSRSTTKLLLQRLPQMPKLLLMQKLLLTPNQLGEVEEREAKTEEAQIEEAHTKAQIEEAHTEGAQVEEV